MMYSVLRSASLQDNQIDFLVPIWISSRITIAPSFGAAWIQDAGTDLHFGVMPKYYFSDTKVSPFIGIRAALLRAIPSGGTARPLAGQRRRDRR